MTQGEGVIIQTIVSHDRIKSALMALHSLSQLIFDQAADDRFIPPQKTLTRGKSLARVSTKHPVSTASDKPGCTKIRSI